MWGQEAVTQPPADGRTRDPSPTAPARPPATCATLPGTLCTASIKQQKRSSSTVGFTGTTPGRGKRAEQGEEPWTIDSESLSGATSCHPARQTPLPEVTNNSGCWATDLSFNTAVPPGAAAWLGSKFFHWNADHNLLERLPSGKTRLLLLIMHRHF